MGVAYGAGASTEDSTFFQEGLIQNMSRVVWVTGAGGLIGHHLMSIAQTQAPGWRVIPIVRPALDLTDSCAVRAALKADAPDLIFHCAAQSRSPACEANPAEARRLNVDVTRLLVENCGKARLLLFSTDQVFDGRTGNYSESAAVNPLGVYGQTKAEAEQVVLSQPKHLVVRTSLTAGRSPTGDRSFTEQMRRAWTQGRTLPLFTDEFRNPLHARFTARAAWELMLQGAQGIHHVAGADRLSRWQIGELLAQQCQVSARLIAPETLATYQGAPRSPDSTLNCQATQRLLRFTLPSFADWIQTAVPSDL